MIPLLIFIALGLTILILFEYRERLRKRQQSLGGADHAGETTALLSNRTDGECCGTHLVCERETIQKMDTKIVYYDDEELDTLAGKDPAAYSEQEMQQVEEVFRSLQEEDVAGWARSLQMRNIALPDTIREEALLIITEQRNRKRN